MASSILVFDYDDTLTRDTERQKQRVWGSAFADIPGAEEVANAYARSHHGVPRRERIAGILHELARRQLVQEPEALVDRYLRRFETQVEDMSVAAPLRTGAEQALGRLVGRYRLYINSATPHDSLQRIIERRGWSTLFAGIYGCPPGSKSEHLKAILEREQAEPASVVMIGDGLGDLAAAEDCGCKFVGVRGEFSAFAPNVSFPILQDLSDLPEVLATLV